MIYFILYYNIYILLILYFTLYYTYNIYLLDILYLFAFKFVINNALIIVYS